MEKKYKMWRSLTCVVDSSALVCIGSLHELQKLISLIKVSKAFPQFFNGEAAITILI